jgi:pyruvate/2-oxoglutarate dehydrogenase complex dihydrolipoamide acyltransferase (E2) component
MTIEIKLPEIGDGIDSGDVLEVLVSVGDEITKDQGLVELETDKATVEVPSSHAGKVTAIHVKVGDTVKIGGALVSLESQSVQATPPAQPPAQPQAAEPKPAPTAAPVAAEKPAPPKTPAVPAATAREDASPAPVPPPRPAAAPVPPQVPTASNPAGIAAGPAIRRFAREVGVDLSLVVGTGEGGRITRDDVLAVVRQASAAVKSGRALAGPDSTITDDYGPIHIEKMPKIRKTIAAKMHESWTTVPRVTNFDDADVTELEHIRQSSKADYAEKGIKLTSMPFLIKAVAMALKEHPAINASIDMEAGEIIYKDYVNVGIAVDTERGLVVPTLRNTDQMSIPGVARKLASVADKVRSGEFGLEDLRGGTFTISNLGSIGGTYSTPIINVPEVAILLVGRSRQMPVVVGNEIKIRLMMPLSLSYDHRLVDGGTAARFLNEVIGYLEAPSRLLMAP